MTDQDQECVERLMRMIDTCTSNGRSRVTPRALLIVAVLATIPDPVRGAVVRELDSNPRADIQQALISVSQRIPPRSWDLLSSSEVLERLSHTGLFADRTERVGRLWGEIVAAGGVRSARITRLADKIGPVLMPVRGAPGHRNSGRTDQGPGQAKSPRAVRPFETRPS